jgi:molybdate transport system substrate-binding protein
LRYVAFAVALLVSACGGSAASAQSPPVTISVFAAASLTDSFKALGDGFHQQRSDVTLQFIFAGTPTLVIQIEEGAHADVFASADTTNMDRLRGDGFTLGTPQVFAHNKLEIAVSPGNPKHITSLTDLAQPGIVYISAGPTVPAGKYAARALQKAGVSVTPRSLETDVRSVVSKIELGEADAGIVYTTDIKAAAGKVDGVAIPDSYNVVATYPLVAVKDSKHVDAANAFIAYVLSATGQSKLESFGFLHA